MIQKTKVRKAFNNKGIQISIATLNQFDEEISRLIDKWVKNTKFGNVKRLTPDLIWIALGKLNK
jgi:hypothetical protein